MDTNLKKPSEDSARAGESIRKYLEESARKLPNKLRGEESCGAAIYSNSTCDICKKTKYLYEYVPYMVRMENNNSFCPDCDIDSLCYICGPVFWNKYKNADIKNIPEKYQKLSVLKNFLISETKSKGLILSGAIGVGKTYIAFALIKQYIENEIRSRMSTFKKIYIKEMLITDSHSLIRNIKQDFKRPDDWDFLKSKPHIVFIDGLGDNENEDNRFFEPIMNHIYNNNLNYIITTNNADDAIAGLYGYRVLSRMVETATIVSVDGKDRRKCQD